MEVSGYNLSWHTFPAHLAEVRRELYQEKYFADLTLLSDDLIAVEAHRLVLSAASPVLRRVLTVNPTVKTQLFLKGIKHQQLDSILKFIYYGEVQVPAREISDFLKAGRELDITELSDIIKKPQECRKNKSDVERVSLEEEASRDMIVLNSEEKLYIKPESVEIIAEGDLDISLENFHQYRGVSPLEVFKHFIFQKDVSGRQFCKPKPDFPKERHKKNNFSRPAVSTVPNILLAGNMDPPQVNLTLAKATL